MAFHSCSVGVPMDDYFGPYALPSPATTCPSIEDTYSSQSMPSPALSQGSFLSGVDAMSLELVLQQGVQAQLTRLRFRLAAANRSRRPAGSKLNPDAPLDVSLCRVEATLSSSSSSLASAGAPAAHVQDTLLPRLRRSSFPSIPNDSLDSLHCHVPARGQPRDTRHSPQPLATAAPVADPELEALDRAVSPRLPRSPSQKRFPVPSVSLYEGAGWGVDSTEELTGGYQVEEQVGQVLQPPVVSRADLPSQRRLLRPQTFSQIFQRIKGT